MNKTLKQMVVVATAALAATAGLVYAQSSTGTGTTPGVNDPSTSGSNSTGPIVPGSSSAASAAGTGMGTGSMNNATTPQEPMNSSGGTMNPDGTTAAPRADRN